MERLDDGRIGKDDFYRIYTEPQTKFQGFSINLDNLNIKEIEYLAIQFNIKSGSNENYYYGISDTVVDNLTFGFINSK
ncbi:hypothetical protein [Aureibaculum luteum]|uniref:hypothetical protein n=1 Tax=Aureibaculum luteum TaxID=1548456 RepID=UPI0013006D9F|nr:hypothetical protein [Aureibaculum luteum]